MPQIHLDDTAVSEPDKVAYGPPHSHATSMVESQQERLYGDSIQRDVDFDGHLLTQIQRGDQEALRVLFNRYARRLRVISFRILRDDAEADDLVQDIFLFIFKKAPHFDGSRGTARSWIFQIAYHRAFDRRRYLNTRHFYSHLGLQELTGDVEEPEVERSFGSRLEAALSCQLDAHFRRLSPEQRETIRLFFFEGYTLREIAHLTNRPLANVRQHYYRGLTRLREIILPEKDLSK